MRCGQQKMIRKVFVDVTHDTVLMYIYNMHSISTANDIYGWSAIFSLTHQHSELYKLAQFILLLKMHLGGKLPQEDYAISH